MTKAEIAYYDVLRKIERSLFIQPWTVREAGILLTVRAVLDETIWTCEICGETWNRNDLFLSEGDCPTEGCGIGGDLILSMRAREAVVE